MRVYDSASMRIAKGWWMSASLSELRRVFETATANIDKVSFTITTVPTTPEDLLAVLTIARARRRTPIRCGAAAHRTTEDHGAVLRQEVS
jgi:hypothetical protein